MKKPTQSRKVQAPVAPKKKTIGLVLGSGGARGWSHFGVLRALDEAGIRPDLITGSSAGAMVGAFLAAGRIDALRAIAERVKWKDVVYYFSDLSRSGKGLVDGRKIDELFRGILGHLTIEELAVPFAAVATDVQTGREVVLRKGDVVKAIRSSISIPGIFSPVPHEGALLVDGGLIDPVPVRVAREMGANIVIAVNVLGFLYAGTAPVSPPAPKPKPAPKKPKIKPALSMIDQIMDKISHLDLAATLRNRPWLKKGRSFHLFDVLVNALRIMEIQIAESRLERDRPDVLIRPRVGEIGALEFHTMAESEAAGYEAAMGQMDEIHRVIAARSA